MKRPFLTKFWEYINFLLFKSFLVLKAQTKKAGKQGLEGGSAAQHAQLLQKTQHPRCMGHQCL